jgi:hypothetical protein
MHLTLGTAASRRAQISSSFLRLIIFLVGRLRRPRPGVELVETQRRASRSHSLRSGTTLYEGFGANRWAFSSGKTIFAN